MTTFIDYLAESVKTYDFKIKIAGDLPDGFDKAMKELVKKYTKSNKKDKPEIAIHIEKLKEESDKKGVKIDE